MRLDIRYKTHFRYAKPVHESQNEVRMRPRDDKYQRVLFYRLVSYPPVRLLQTFDYWGTAVDHLGVRAPHTELELVAESTVDTKLPPLPSTDASVEALKCPDFCSRNYEFLLPSQHVKWQPGDAVSKRALEVVSGAESVSEMIVSVVNETRNILRYERGSTEIGVSLDDLLIGRSGVCQDFAHLAIGMLRSVGVPACYVSGYLFAVDETRHDGGREISVVGTGSEGTGTQETTINESDVVSLQTHAWITAAIPGSDWWALDPTNGGVTGERHVVIGYGRDYGDVPPVRGAFMGPGTADVDAEVVIGRQDVARDDSYGLAKPHGPPHIVLQPRIVVARHDHHQSHHSQRH